MRVPMLFLLALLVCVSAEAATWHVAQQRSNASDTNPGTAEAPWKTISQAAKKVQPGDLVEIATGVYREHVNIENSGLPGKPIRFEAAMGARVVVTGADQLDSKGFTRESGPESARIYSTSWPYRFLPSSKTGAHPDDDHHELVGRCEQVIIDGYLMHQVLDRSQLSRGSFYADLKNKRLCIWHRANLDLTERGPCRNRVEAATRFAIWTMAGSNLHTRGITFRHAANSAQQGAVSIKGASCLIEDCTVERTNGVGLGIAGEDAIVRRCLIRENGQLGFGGCYAHRLLVTACEVRGNNTKGFSRGWEAGADKLCLSRDVVLEKSTFADNRGSGIWFDVGNENPTVRNCLIMNNEGCGVFYEISLGLHAHDNVVIGNGFDEGGGAWGANGAIALSSSPGCTVERNLMIGNCEGFQFREQGRTTPRINQAKGVAAEPVWNHDQVIRNNVMAYNAKWQIGGWFDMPDRRYLPMSMKARFRAQGTAPSAIEDIAKDAQGQPASLSLESLHIKFQNNIYARNPGEGFVLWGAAWQHGHKSYSELGPWRSELGIDEGSIEAPVVFADLAELDFRVPAGSPAIKMGCYPQGEVPGVVLGVYTPSRLLDRASKR